MYPNLPPGSHVMTKEMGRALDKAWEAADAAEEDRIRTSGTRLEREILAKYDQPEKTSKEM